MEPQTGASQQEDRNPERQTEYRTTRTSAMSAPERAGPGLTRSSKLRDLCCCNRETVPGKSHNRGSRTASPGLFQPPILGKPKEEPSQGQRPHKLECYQGDIRPEELPPCLRRVLIDLRDLLANERGVPNLFASIENRNRDQRDCRDKEAVLWCQPSEARLPPPLTLRCY